MIGHADHSHVIDPAHRAQIFTPNGMLPGSLLVDGFVAGTWTIQRGAARAELRIATFDSLRAKDRAQVNVEGRRLLAFHSPEAPRHALVFARWK